MLLLPCWGSHTHLWSLKQLQGPALLSNPLSWSAVSDLTQVELQEGVVHHLMEVMVLVGLGVGGEGRGGEGRGGEGREREGTGGEGRGGVGVGEGQGGE